MASRPEHQLPPELYYNEDEARKYTHNTRIMEIQSELAERAIEMLALPYEGAFILDIGCGSGLSGECLTEAGHHWVGIDISSSMIDVAIDREVEGDLLLVDMGQGMPFRAGVFDAAISISALQWLCNADKSSHNPVKRMKAPGGRAVMQLYPEDSKQLQLLLDQAKSAGFTGGLVVDWPNSTKRKKFYIVLDVGGNRTLPKADGMEISSTDKFSKKAESRKKGRKGLTPNEYKRLMKERALKRGRDVPNDSRYSGRKRARIQF